MIPALVFLFCLFLTYAFYLIVTRRSEARRELLRRRLAEALLYSAHTDETEAVMLARVDSMSEIDWANSILVRLKLATQLKSFIDQADLNLTVMRLLLFSGLAGVLGTLAVSMVTISLIMSVLGGIAAATLPFLHVMWRRRQRLDKFLALLPDTLELMSRALQAGHAFTESLHMISTEMPEPIATEFHRTYEEQNLGLSLKLALGNLLQRIPILDLRICVTAVMIQRETGGNLAEILEKVANTIRERFRIMNDLKTLTTGSRMSAWMLCALPAFIASVLTVINPEYMSMLWRDPRGHNLIAIALLMQITGMLIVRKIVQIKV